MNIPGRLPIERKWREFHDEQYRNRYGLGTKLDYEWPLFCKACGAPCRWIRAFDEYNEHDGRFGGVYIYRCPNVDGYPYARGSKPHFDAGDGFHSTAFRWFAGNVPEIPPCR